MPTNLSYMFSNLQPPKPVFSKKQKKAIVVSIEGNIGSGKSTIIDFLKENSEDKSYIFLPEPINEWDEITDRDGNTILKEFYKNQSKYSFSFQMMAYISRLDLLRKTINDNPEKVIITERSLYTDKYVFAQMLFDKGKMNEIEFKIYNKWFKSFLDLAPLHKVIYLRTDPKVSFSRILKRNRNGEDEIPYDYIENCHKYHESMFNILEIKDKKVIDCTADFETNSNYFLNINSEINEFLK